MTRSRVGDGDDCPAGHGPMLADTKVTPARQFCPHVAHDGVPGQHGEGRTRSIWPLYGFEAAVAAERVEAAVAAALAGVRAGPILPPATFVAPSGEGLKAAFAPFLPDLSDLVGVTP